MTRKYVAGVILNGLLIAEAIMAFGGLVALYAAHTLQSTSII
jgi:hypothetical protein